MSIFNDLFSLIALSKQSGIKVREAGGGGEWVGCYVGGVVLRDNLVLSTELTMSVSLLIELIENRSPSFHHSDERLTLETLALETL